MGGSVGIRTLAPVSPKPEKGGTGTGGSTRCPSLELQGFTPLSDPPVLRFQSVDPLLPELLPSLSLYLPLTRPRSFKYSQDVDLPVSKGLDVSFQHPSTLFPTNPRTRDPWSLECYFHVRPDFRFHGVHISTHCNILWSCAYFNFVTQTPSVS